MTTTSNEWASNIEKWSAVVEAALVEIPGETNGQRQARLTKVAHYVDSLLLGYGSWDAEYAPLRELATRVSRFQMWGQQTPPVRPAPVAQSFAPVGLAAISRRRGAR